MATKEGVVIGVFKDLGSESVVAPPVWQAFIEGHQTHFLVEGKGGQRFLKTYIQNLASSAYCSSEALEVTIGSDDFEKRPCSIDLYEYIDQRIRNGKKEIPSAVLIGESSPINIERQVAFVVEEINTYRNRKIKLVVCQDFWGSACIVGKDIKPDCVLSVDEYGKKLALETYSHLKENDVIVVGNPGVKDVIVSEEIRVEYDRLKEKYDSVYFFAGGGKETSEQLRLLNACLSRTQKNWFLVVGFHPKLVEQYGGEWRPIIKEFGDRSMEALPGTGEQWGAVADVTVSGASTILTTAVKMGKIAISLGTKEIKEVFRKRNMDMVPQVAMGWAHNVETPMDLSQFGRPTAEALKKLQSHDPVRAFKAVDEILY